MTSRTCALIAAGCLAWTGAAQAEASKAASSYPSRTVTMVVTAAAGGVTDVVARALANRLTEMWGQSVVIENRGGAAHIFAAQAVTKAQPDGHTLMVAERATFVIHPQLYPKDEVPFDVEKGLTPITGLVRIHHSFITSPKLPYNSVKEVIEAAKKKPRSISYGTAGMNSGPHVNMARLENRTGVSFLPIHYRGSTPAMNDLLGGHTDMMMISVSHALPLSQAGKVKMLGIGSEKRLPQASDTPTIAESGNVPGFTAGTWFGLAVTGGTPDAVVEKINADVRKIIAEPAFRDKFLKTMMYDAIDSSPAEFRASIKAETADWARVIKEQNLTMVRKK